MDDMIKYLQDFASENLVTYAYNIVAALVIFVIGKLVASRVAAVSRNLFSKKIDVTVANCIANLTNIAVLAFVVIAAPDRLGVETTSIVAIVGAAGLAVGLALKGALGSLAA